MSYSCFFRSSLPRKRCRLSFGVTDRNCVIVDSALAAESCMRLAGGHGGGGGEGVVHK